MIPSLVDLPWLPPPPEDFAQQCRALGHGGVAAGSSVQFLANSKLSPKEGLLLTRAIRRCQTSHLDLAPLSSFRLGVVAGNTFDLLIDCFPTAAARHGVALDVIATPYDQVLQQALEPKSQINKAGLDAVLIAVDHRWLALDRCSLDGATSRVDAAIGKLRSVVFGVREYGSSSAILSTLPCPPEPLFGNYDRRVRGTVRAMIDDANRAIIALADDTGSYLLDCATLAEQVGTERWFDPIKWFSYKLPFSPECFEIYSDMLGRLLGSIRGKARKCLVLDLDNTVWGGVIGDDGVGGIELGQGSARGEAFLAVQQAALDLRERGIMLAVCSKNNDAVAREPFRDHPEMILRENHISVFQANWIDKAHNLQAIAKKLNIGLDALVLLDDNPAERAQLRAAFPDVAVPELPADPSWFPWFLTAPGYFEAVSFSTEDRLRVESYASDAQRAEVLAKALNLGDYLTSLEMRIRFAPFDIQNRRRISQLINKTNQFNLTTRRYTEAQVAQMENDDSIFTLQVRLEDRFGDLGLIAVVICRESAQTTHREWEVDTWLMSCRVLGRRVEEAVLSKVVADAKARGVAYIIGTYIPSAKNKMVADHYRDLGFEQIDPRQPGHSRWQLSVLDYSFPALPMQVEEKLVHAVT
jgi:FkbH-like protein